MRVAMYYNNRDVRIEEAPKPSIGPGELLMKIHSSGICGSDLMEWYRIHKAPLILGHETAGEVVEVGLGVESFKLGDRIVATHHVPCFNCHYCRTGHETMCDTLLGRTRFMPGGFCEYTRLHAINVRSGIWKLPDSVSYDEGTFVEPLGCVLRGQSRARLRPGATVLVLGSGISGLLHTNLAAATGAGLVIATDIDGHRLEAAKKFGADLAFHAGEDIPSLIRENNNGRGADIVVVCATAKSVFLQAFNAVERGGTILVFAPTMEGVTIPLSINDLFWRRDVTVTTTYAASPSDCATALELIARKRIKVEEMITHRLGLSDTVKGFRLAAEAGRAIKVIIRPQE